MAFHRIYWGYICPYCGNGDIDDYILKPSKPPFCISCKRKLEQIKCAKCGKIHNYADVDRFCPDCGHEYAKIRIKCTNGHVNPYKHLYCTNCGVLLDRDERNWTASVN